MSGAAIIGKYVLQDPLTLPYACARALQRAGRSPQRGEGKRRDLTGLQHFYKNS